MGWQSALDPHGQGAARLFDLTLFLFAACALVWLLVMAAATATLRKRRGAFEVPTVPSGPERRSTLVVSCAVAATAVVVTGFTVVSFFTTRALTAAAPDAPVVRIRAYQWWWEATYTDDEPQRVVTVANEIHIPVGTPVRFRLEAPDVIHSFWVPSLAGKQDLIPGRNNEITIRADRAGVYRGQCAEFCGLQHAHMAFLVVAEPSEDFARWLDAQRKPAASPSDEETATGRAVFLGKGCAACHTVAGTGAAGTLGPDLTHVASRRYLAAGLLPTTRGSLAAWIADPQTIKPGNNMPIVPLGAEELAAVSAYMASLR